MSPKQKQKTVETESNFIPLAEAAKRSGYTPEYLNSLSRKGILRAKKIGRNWHTTDEWISDFLEEVAKEKKYAKEGIAPVEVNLAETIREDEATFEEDKAGLSKKRAALIRDEISELITHPQNTTWLQLFAGLTALVIIVPVVFVFMNFAKYQLAKYQSHGQQISILDTLDNFVIMNENGSSDVFSRAVSGVVKGEATANQNAEADNAGIILASENYKARQVAIGGGVIALTNGEDSPLEISDIRSESFVSSKKDEVKLVILWKTNKMAVSEIGYSKNNGQNPKKIKEQSYGFNHSVILAELEPRTSYVYSLAAKDRWGNSNSSNYFGIYTASKPISVFDMIAKAVSEIFGWAISK